MAKRVASQCDNIFIHMHIAMNLYKDLGSSCFFSRNFLNQLFCLGTEERDSKSV